ncbi:TetR/AcrR family transcriptional regulator [Pseudonocardia halophobica]|uniref:TetR/AcrR family transcriptional regulator n=1 Tax=Pseudonocardia halophobica TaxID=29401 RepID=UPI00068B0700|nr:TetR/AcrR family transcriptional regulator [Pseudonocardia halophobica]
MLAVADQLFYERGIHAVGVDTIVARADTAKTTLYGHFGSKDALVDAYLQRRSQLWQEHVEAEIAASDSGPAARILRVFEVLGRSLAEPGFRGCPFINACAEFADDHAAAATARAHRRWLHGVFARLADQAGAADPELLATQLGMLYDGSMVAAHVDSDRAAATTARAAAAALLIASGIEVDTTAAVGLRSGSPRCSPLVAPWERPGG